MDDKHTPAPTSVWDNSLSVVDIQRIQTAIDEYSKSQNVQLIAPITISLSFLLVIITLGVFFTRRAKQRKKTIHLTQFDPIILPTTPTRARSPFLSPSATTTAHTSPDSGTVTPPPRLQERRFLLSRALSQKSITASRRGNRTAFHIPIFKSPTRPPRPISNKPLDLEIGWAVSQAADHAAAESTLYAFPLEPIRPVSSRRHTPSYADERIEQDGVVTAEIGLARDFPAPKTSEDDIPLIHAEYCYDRIQDNFGRVRTPSPARVQYRRGRVLGEDDLELLRRSYEGSSRSGWK